jgi:hypothetical protein
MKGIMRMKRRVRATTTTARHPHRHHLPAATGCCSSRYEWRAALHLVTSSLQQQVRVDCCIALIHFKLAAVL